MTPPAVEVDLATVPFLSTDTNSRPRVSPAGDANADGLADVWVSQGSTAHLLAGPLDADADLTGAIATVDTTEDATTDRLVVGGRDLTGDGEADLLVTEACVYGTDGRVALHAGPFAGPRASSDAVATFTITAGDQLFGCFGADVGDLDGDGLAEIAIGVADDSYASGTAEGDIGIWSGAATGTQTALDADVILRASAAAVAGFDGDGDGNSDLLLQDFGGFGWVLRGPVLDGATLPDAADTTILGIASATPAPDIDGDGGADLLVTSAAEGRIWLVPGGLGGAVGPAEPMWSAVGPLDASLSAPATGDMDGDGWPDLAVGARGCCATGEAGRVWLISGVGL